MVKDSSIFIVVSRRDATFVSDLTVLPVLRPVMAHGLYGLSEACELEP